MTRLRLSSGCWMCGSAEYFGNKKAQITTSVYAGAIVADNYSKANQEDKRAIETALALAKTKHFFHWELEFPEVLLR